VIVAWLGRVEAGLESERQTRFGDQKRDATERIGCTRKMKLERIRDERMTTRGCVIEAASWSVVMNRG
jgi:hypothetical protein